MLRTAAWPMLGAMAVTLTALLLERALRLLDVLSASSNRTAYLVELLLSLLPYYLGLTLPAAFFLAMFVCFSRMSDGSEVDAMLASGVSIERIAAPFLVAGAALAAVSLILSGFVQPEARYTYRLILHAAETGGWNGRLQSQTFVSPGARASMTADGADSSGRVLRGVFIRQVLPDGRERVTTAERGVLAPERDGRHVLLLLTRGEQVRHDAQGEAQVLSFQDSTLELELPPSEARLRDRGLDERELTLGELARRPQANPGALPRRRLRAELYGRLAAALALPFLPLLALPLSLAAKRGGRATSVLVAALVLFLFQHLLQIGQGLGAKGKVPALLAVGSPFLAFAALSTWIFLSSRLRPGETPVARAVERLAGLARRARGALRGLPPPNDAEAAA
ncbi:MAG: LptF/LptG family permease [Caulobacteraceae bacterium]|nr:LptF/LptG family permease [Caulobacter sp.]